MKRMIPGAAASVCFTTHDLPLSNCSARGQLDPRTRISSVPCLITAPGSYYLTTHLTTGAGAASSLNANNVTLDLNASTIASTEIPAASSVGILLNAPANIITTHNLNSYSSMKTSWLILLVAVLAFCQVYSVRAFEGRIMATLTRGGDVQSLLYTVGSNYVRVEQSPTHQPHPRDIFNLQTGEVTLLFPHNRSFMRLKNGGDSGNAQSPGGGRVPPQMPSPSAMPAPALLPSPSGMSAAPLMLNPPTMPALRMESLKLQSTGEITNLLGFACTRYEIKQHGETMEIWATDQLLPFTPYVEVPPHRFGPRMLEEQWGGLLQSRKLFPLAAVLRFDNGAERLRFAVSQVQPQKLTVADGKLFLPPDGYNEIPSMPY